MFQQEKKWHRGQNIDVLDSVKKWVNAEVVFVGNGTIYVHYSGWSAKYDESIPVGSERLLSQWQPNQPIRLNNRVDAYHPKGGWLEARVVEMEDKATVNKVKVHFTNYHPKYDIWVDIRDNNQVTTIGSRSKAYGIGKKKNKSPTKLSQLITKLLEERGKLLVQNLRNKNMMIKRSGGDGNCLFRSISHQLYGVEDHHMGIRHLCLDYISFEKGFFQAYVAGDFNEYISMKRKDGAWGDDLEIQALSEIYSRPIQIYVFGEEPIRTFHEENQHSVQPMRLAYIGACHYDSIKRQQAVDTGLMNSSFGEFQDLFLSTYKNQMNSILRNRSVFATCNRLEDTIGERLEAENRNETKIENQLNKALEISQTEALLDEIQNAEMREIQKRAQQEKIEEQLKKIEQKEIEQVKKLSRHDPEPLHPEKPYWFDDLVAQGFAEKQIWFAIQCKGFDPDAVQNFLFDNVYL